MQTLKKKVQGFTIIEVMIVLVIAAVILLIVFLAIPALQRNSRNTQRKNDVSAMLAAVNEYATNNGGKLPDSASTFFSASQNAKQGFYKAPTSATDLGDWNFTANSNTTVTGSAATAFIKTGAKCNSAGDNFGGPNASGRYYAVVYTVETGGGTQVLCQQS